MKVKELHSMLTEQLGCGLGDYDILVYDLDCGEGPETLETVSMDRKTETILLSAD